MARGRHEQAKQRHDDEAAFHDAFPESPDSSVAEWRLCTRVE